MKFNSQDKCVIQEYLNVNRDSLTKLTSPGMIEFYQQGIDLAQAALDQCKACFVVPLHPPKFEDAKRLLASNSFNYDILWVFSSAQDFDCFGMPELPHIIHAPTSSPVTQKKFAGLREAFTRGYRFAAAIDAECVFTKAVDLYDTFYHRHHRKTLYAATATESITREINIKCASVFSEVEREQLKALTNDFSLYFWFNDVPVYHSETFQRFSAAVTLHQPHHMMFDYILYGFYCLLHEGWELKTLHQSSTLALLESQSIIPQHSFKGIVEEMQPLWVMREVPGYDNAFIHFHLDRK